MAFNLIQKYYNQKGVDLKSNDLSRSTEFAADMLNCQYDKNGNLEKRKGYRGFASEVGGLGLFNFYNASRGVNEILTMDNYLHRYVPINFTVIHIGALSFSFGIHLNTATQKFYFELIENSIILLSIDLGTGLENAPYMAETLRAAIDGLANFTATATGDFSTYGPSAPAAFLIIPEVLTTTIFTTYYYEQVHCETTNPFGSHYAERTSSNFENATATQINGCMYFGTTQGSTSRRMYKYDGLNLYRAGVPTPSTVTSASGVAGAITGNNYLYLAQYKQVDAQGNIIEGNYTLSTTPLSVAAKKIDVTINQTIDRAGFNTKHAIVNGNQAAVTTITVDNPHTLEIGDTAYFLNTATGLYVEKVITNISATSITFSGSVSVSDNSLISNNLRLSLFRSQTSGSTPELFYLVAELPSIMETISYTDNTPDASLGALFFPPATDRSVPTPGRYVNQWQGKLIVCGAGSVGAQSDMSRTVYYSDIDGPEYFPSDSNQILIDTEEGEEIIGSSANNDVFIINTDRSFVVLYGDLATAQLRLDYKSRLSCASHASFEMVEGELFWLSSSGPRRTTAGNLPYPLGQIIDGSGQQQNASRIDNIMDLDFDTPSNTFIFKKSVGFNDTIGQRYILFIPCHEIIDNYPLGREAANSNSRIYAYDYQKDSWLVWSNINMMGGMIQFGNDIIFQERRYDPDTATIKKYLYKINKNGLDSDYSDHNAPINASYTTQWESLGNPSVLKKFQNIKVFTLDDVTPTNLNVGAIALTVRQEIDYKVGTFVNTIDFPYGLDFKTHGLYRTRARSTRFTFLNDEPEARMAITGWEVECATPYRKEFKP